MDKVTAGKNLIENISRQLSSTNSSSKLALEILLMEI